MALPAPGAASPPSVPDAPSAHGSVPDTPMPGADTSLATLLAQLPDGDATPTNAADSIVPAKTFTVQLPSSHIPLRLASAPGTAADARARLTRAVGRGDVHSALAHQVAHGLRVFAAQRDVAALLAAAAPVGSAQR